MNTKEKNERSFSFFTRAKQRCKPLWCTSCMLFMYIILKYTVPYRGNGITSVLGTHGSNPKPTAEAEEINRKACLFQKA